MGSSHNHDVLKGQRFEVVYEDTDGYTGEWNIVAPADIRSVVFIVEVVALKRVQEENDGVVI